VVGGSSIPDSRALDRANSGRSRRNRTSDSGGILTVIEKSFENWLVFMKIDKTGSNWFLRYLVN
jgi:hypothetical protein